MERLTSYLLRARARIASMGPVTGAVAAVLVLLAVGGGAWLVVASSGEAAKVALTAEPIDAAQLAVLARELDARRISHTTRDGRLYVDANDLATAREAAAGPDVACEMAMAAMRKLTESDGLWSDRAQRERQLQAAKMALLSAQISSLPGVRSATVILSPASEARIGRPRQSGSASVKFTTPASAPMDEALCETIAHMVCSAVPGIRRENVCIVDGQGRRYSPAPALPVEGVIARTCQAEAYYAARIRHALSYIGSPIVSVRAAAGPGGGNEIGRCLSVSVSIDWGYVVAAHRAHGGGQGLDAFADLRKMGIAQTVMREAQLEEPRAVVVTWHDDVAIGPPGRREPSTGSDAAAPGGLSVSPVALAIGVAAVLAGVCLFWRRRAAGPFRARGGSSENAGRELEIGADSGPGRPGGHFAFLLDISDQKLVSLLEGEHPQTTALVLAHLGPGKAAAVLSALGPKRQVDVVRRIASLGTPAGEVAGEIARGLAARLGRSTSVEAGPDGISTAAEILHHAGYDAEQAVLDDLASDEPDLADSIRRRMFVFDDIASLPTATVAEALGPLASEDIAVALRTAGDGIRDKVLSGLSSAAAGQVRKAMGRIGPVRLSDVEAAQQRLASAVRQACDGRYVVDVVEGSEDTYADTGAE